MIALILCNGPEDKWGQDTPRHFVEVDGERLIDRTVRQFGAHGDVVVSGPDLRYKIPGAALYVPKAEPENLDADILLSTRHLWSAQDRTLVILGDTWFSDAAIESILARSSPEWFTGREWFYVGRENGSRYSGTDYGELFGLSFWPEHQEQLLNAMYEVLRLQQAGFWRGGLWEHYRVLRGIDPMEHRIDGHFLEIDDQTDDFDFPDRFEEWVRNRAA